MCPPYNKKIGGELVVSSAYSYINFFYFCLCFRDAGLFQVVPIVSGSGMNLLILHFIFFHFTILHLDLDAFYHRL